MHMPAVFIAFASFWLAAAVWVHTLENEKMKNGGLIFLLLFVPSVSMAEPQTTIMVSNPFSVKLRIEVKCDHMSGTVDKYKYFQRIWIPKKSFIKLLVPKSLSFCEIWALNWQL